MMNYANPYPYYAEKRNNDPVFQDEQGYWSLTRYQDVVLLLSDPRFRRRPPASIGYFHRNEAETRVEALISKWSLFSDPPSHTHLREMLSHIIHPRFIKDTKVIIQTVVDQLISSMLKQDDVNFMECFAYQLPITVINKLLGTDIEVSTVRRWSFAVAMAIDHGRQEELESIASVIMEIETYFYDLVRERENNLGTDWISELIKLKEAYQLSTEDVASNAIFILLASHETLQLSMGLGLLNLIKHPDQITLLQSNPDLIPSAVEEILRYDAPWNKMSRWAYEDIQFGSVTIPKHQLVTGLINSANRDPLRFANPDKFDITRSNNRHLAFGHGIHLCHGAIMARLELHATFAALLPYLHKLSVDDNEIIWMPNSSLRYITNLPIHIQR